MVNEMKSHSGWMASWCIWHQTVPCEKPPCVTWPSPVLCAPPQLCLCLRLLRAGGLPRVECLHPMGERPKRKGCKICSFPQQHCSSPSWAGCWRKWELAHVLSHWEAMDSRRQKGIRWGKHTCQRVLHQEGGSSMLCCSFSHANRQAPGLRKGRSSGEKKN